MADITTPVPDESNTSGFKCLRAHILRNRLKILVGIIISIGSLVIPISIVNPPLACSLVMYYGYWVILAVFTSFLVFLVRETIRDNELLPWIRDHRWALIVALGLTGYLFVNDWHGFKILFDEHLISGTAMNMHFHQQAGLYKAVHIFNNEPIGFSPFVDKRPLFFPFLISLFHKATGYRPENVVYLNTLLTFFCLVSLYAIVARLSNRMYGLIAMALLAGLPLLAENATGGGFDVANILLVNALFISAALFVGKPDALRLNLMVATSLLLANTRYESTIYVLVPCVILLWAWLRGEKLALTWYAVISPVFLVLPLLIYRFNFSEGGSLYLEQGSFFRFQNIVHNLRHACVYLFSFRDSGTNSLLLSILGSISTVILLVISLTRFRLRNTLPAVFVPLFTVSCCVIVTIFIALLWGWGEWTDPLAARFSLPLQWLWAIFIPVVFYHLFKLRKPPFALTLVTLVFLLGINYPLRGDQRNELKFLPAKEYAWAIDYLRKHNLTDDSLFISSGVYGLQLYRLASIGPEVANESPSAIRALMRYGVYKNIYTIQEIQTDYVKDRETDVWIDRISSDFVLETVAEKRFKINQLMRISRITEITGDLEVFEFPEGTELTEKQYARFLFGLLPKAQEN